MAGRRGDYKTEGCMSGTFANVRVLCLFAACMEYVQVLKISEAHTLD